MKNCHIILLLLTQYCLSNVFMKVDKLERCIVDFFNRNQEVMLRLELFNPEIYTNYEMKIVIKDIEYQNYETEKFVVKDEKKKNFIYTHTSSNDVLICFQADRDVFFKIEVDANIKMPENLIQAEHMREFEDYLYKTLQNFVDFNAKRQVSGKESALFD